MNRKRITSKDIAKAAGVSPTAVSFALNGKEGISSETRRCILEVAEELGYKPPAAKKESLNIALLFRNDLHDLDQLFYTELNTSMIAACKELPYNLVMTSVYRTDSNIVFSDILHSGIIDGIIVYGDLENDVLNELINLHIPFVVLDSSRKRDDHYAVRVDYKTAAYKAACHLISLGHRDIAYIGNNNKSVHDFNLLTFSGFQKATTENDIALGTNRIQLEISDEKSLHRCIDKALQGSNMPTALFCATDYYGILAIRYLHSIGFKVPGDISVIGIDDIAISQYMIPSLTTVKIDREEIGRRGFELIQKLINNEPCESINLDSYDVIIRESVAAPAR